MAFNMNPHQGASPAPKAPPPKPPPMKAAPADPAAEPMPEAEGPVHEHLRALHDQMGGEHMHIHSAGGKLTSHQVGDDGEVEGPHDHQNLEVLKQALSQFFTEEEQEQPAEPAGQEPAGLTGLEEM